MPCPYANLLGVPGQGVHSTRFAGLAVFDTVATIILAIVMSYVFDVALWKMLVFWFVLGEVLHYAFRTQTAFLTMVGISTGCSTLKI